VKRLGLPPTTERTFIGFMGCYAAFNALRVAHGFCQSRPDARVLDVVGENLPSYVDGLLSVHDLTQEALDFWAIHPGGRRIVEGAQDALGLSDADVADSLAVLRRYGNMSSPTILFVLQRILERQAQGDGAPPEHGVAMAFGPGLTIEGALFERV
jgi:predicted naringenin-chalcone synthase